MGEPGSAIPLGQPLSQAAGPTYGEQSSQDWLVGQSDDRPVLDLPRAVFLWRVTVLGENVLVDVEYGTKANKRIVNLATPFQLTVPGQCNVSARPLDPQAAASVRVTATPATAGDSSARRIVVGPALALDPDATSFRALTASTVTIRGIAVAVPVLGVVALVAGSVLTAGSGYLEFTT